MAQTPSQRGVDSLDPALGGRFRGTARPTVVIHHGRKSESLTRAWYAGGSRRFPEGRPSPPPTVVWDPCLAGGRGYRGVEVLTWLTSNFSSPTSTLQPTQDCLDS